MSFESPIQDQQAAPPEVQRELQRSGQPLPAPIRADLQERFQYDLSSVRIHADRPAAASAEAVDAHAYTVGRHIVFGPGRYRPGSTEGRQLLAHELTHVVQQGGGDAPAGRLPIASDDNAEERQALSNGERMRPVAAGSTGAQVQRRSKKKGSSKQKQTYGVRFSPESQISAAQMLEIIQRSPALEPWMRDSFAVDGDRLVLAASRIRNVKKKKPVLDVPRGVAVPPWFAKVLFAMSANEWYVTTAASLVSSTAQVGLEADLDQESRHFKGMPPRTGHVALGHTFSSEQRFSRNGLRGALQRGQPANPAARRLDEGLIVVANRFQGEAGSRDAVLRDEERILETLLHELAAHGEQIRQGQDSEAEHTSPNWQIGLEPMSEADKTAKQIYDHFGGDRASGGEQQRIDCARSLAAVTPIGVITDPEDAAVVSEQIESFGRFVDACSGLIDQQQVRKTRRSGDAP